MRLRALLVLLVGLRTPVLLRAQEPVRINYVDADLGDVIRSLATVLGVNVVLTDVPSRRLTFRTPEPVPAPELGAVLEAILESQGLVLVQTGPVAQVMSEAKRPATGPLRVGKELPRPPPLGLITQIVPFDHIRADEAVALLKQTASKIARVEVVPRSNSVLITDRGVNIARYLELLKQLDVMTGGESGLRTYVYPLKHASAPELAGTLGQLFGATAAAPSERTRVKALEDRSLSSELQTFRRREAEAFQERAQMQPPAPPPVAPPATGADSVPGDQQSAGGLVGQTIIVPDQATNALVIRTAPPNFPVLQETIDQLDVRPPQVLLEVLIVEVQLDRASEFGVNWQLFTQELVSGDSSRGITGAYGPQVFTDNALNPLGGLGIRIVSMANVSVRAIVQALATRNKIKVLSTPRVLALNNEEARILVGSQVPFNASIQTGLNVVVAQSVQFQSVGTQLTIIPTVNQDGYVTFRMLQEVSQLTNQVVQSALNAPIISTREAETSAIVKNGNTIIIGGLIGETQSVGQSGVPILQDIPLLGGLFRSRSTSRQRTELAIFVTPHVVFNDEQADSLLRSQREKFRGSKPMIDSMLAPPAPIRPNASAEKSPLLGKSPAP